MTEITQLNEKTGRKYVSSNGRAYPSVTTVLGKFEDKKWLKKWKENNADHAAQTYKASSTGTRVHTCNEDLLLTGTVDFKKYEDDPKVSEENLEEIKARHYAYLPFLAYVNPISVEEKLIWERFDGVNYTGYGGTVDLVGHLKDASVLKEVIVNPDSKEKTHQEIFTPEDQVIFVADYKNYKSAKKPEDCIKAFCQLAAYAAAKNETLSAENKIRHGILLSTTCSEKKKKTNLYIYYLDLDHLNYYFGWFNLFVQGWHGLVDPKTIKWWDFKSEATGVYKEAEDPDTGKAIWGKRDKNYLGKILELI